MQLSAEERQKLVDAGFSDQDIVSYESDQSQQTAPAPVSPEQADTGLPAFSETEIPASATPPASSGVETAGAVAGKAMDIASYAVEHPFQTAGAVTAISAIPGINRLPGFSQVNEMRKAATNKLTQSSEQANINTEKARVDLALKKIALEKSQLALDQARANTPQQTFEALSKNYAPAQEAAAGQRMVAPGQAMPPQVAQPQQPPNAQNFIERMHGLADKYKTANPVVFKKPEISKTPAMRTPGGGMEGGMQPIQIQQAPDISPELRRYKEQNMYNTFNR